MFDLVDHKILLSKLSVCLCNLNSLSFSVHTLEIEYNVFLFVVLTLLKELLNMVYQKGQSWDLYSSASILMTYLNIYHQTLQNVICSHNKTTLHTTGKSLKSITQIKKIQQLCLDHMYTHTHTHTRARAHPN